MLTVRRSVINCSPFCLLFLPSFNLLSCQGAAAPALGVWVFDRTTNKHDQPSPSPTATINEPVLFRPFLFHLSIIQTSLSLSLPGTLLHAKRDTGWAHLFDYERAGTKAELCPPTPRGFHQWNNQIKRERGRRAGFLLQVGPSTQKWVVVVMTRADNSL